MNKKIIPFGKVLSFSSTIPVIVFYIYYLMASIKIGKFATAKNDYNPFYDVFDGVSIYNFFSGIVDYMFGYFIFCAFIPYAILGFFIPSIRISKTYYLNWLFFAVVFVLTMCSENFGGWMFD